MCAHMCAPASTPRAYLHRHESADLVASRARVEVSVALLVWHLLDDAFDTDL